MTSCITILVGGFNPFEQLCSSYLDQFPTRTGLLKKTPFFSIKKHLIYSRFLNTLRILTPQNWLFWGPGPLLYRFKHTLPLEGQLILRVVQFNALLPPSARHLDMPSALLLYWLSCPENGRQTRGCLEENRLVCEGKEAGISGDLCYLLGKDFFDYFHPD